MILLVGVAAATTLPHWCDWQGTQFVPIEGVYDPTLDACLASETLDRHCAAVFEPGAASACPTFVELLTQLDWFDPYDPSNVHAERCLAADGSPLDTVSESVWFAATGEMIAHHDVAEGPPPESGEAGTCFVCDDHVVIDVWWGPPVDATCTDDYTRQDFGAPTTETECANFADDDFDDVKDCLDPDCVDLLQCQCSGPEVVALEPPFQLTGSTSGAPSCHEAPCPSVAEVAPDASFVYTPPWDGQYVLDTIGTGWDTVLYAKPDFDDQAHYFECNDSYEGHTCGDLCWASARESRIELHLDGGEPVVVVVDGRWPDSFGPFVLNVSGTRDPEAAESAPSPSCGCGTSRGTALPALAFAVWGRTRNRRSARAANPCAGDGDAAYAACQLGPRAGSTGGRRAP